MSAQKIRIVIADDHHILLDGLKALLQKQKDIEVAGFYDNGLLLYNDLEKALPDIALIDINMPGLNGLELALKMKDTHPVVKVMALSMHDDAGHIMEMIEAGVCAYLFKNINNDELLDAIRAVAKGKTYYSDTVAEKIAAFVLNSSRKPTEPDKPELTARELEILKLVAQEYSNARIAETLFISERTVETHRKNMLRKSGNKSMVGLLKYALEHQLI